MVNPEDLSPEDFATGMIVLPDMAMREILHHMQEALDDGRVEEESRAYYQDALNIWLKLIDGSQTGRTFVFNYAPVPFEVAETPESAQEAPDALLEDLLAEDTDATNEGSPS